MCFDHEMFFAGPWTVWALGTRMNQEPLRQTSFFIPFPCEFLGISTASKDINRACSENIARIQFKIVPISGIS